MTKTILRSPLLWAACLAALPVPLLAADGAAKCTYLQVASLPIRYAGPGLVPAIEGSIDGTPATMLIDTGSDKTFLTRTATEKRDMVLHMTGTYVTGFGGDSRVYAVRLKDFGIGPTHISRRFELPVIGDTSFVPTFDAILGAPFLFKRDMEISLRDKELKLFQAQDCDQTYLGYWKEESIEIPFESNRRESPNPHFAVVLNGRKLDAIVDTGAHHSLVTLDAAKKAGIKVDAPGVKRLTDSGGIGSVRAPHWSAPIETLGIGGETIRGGEIGVIESQGAEVADVYLGQDFLRAHKVLFALSQRKLYLAYLGGAVFSRRDGLEPWMRDEADAGNADAQYAVATMYASGRGVARDLLVANTWLERAAESGSPQANLQVGRNLLHSGRYPDAVAHLRRGLDQLPAERYGELWLYLARVRNGEADLGKRELETRTGKHHDDAWPAAIADFYLGNIDADKLLNKASREDYQPKQRACEARTFIAEWLAAHGDKERARAVVEAGRAECAPKPAQPKAAS